MMDWDAAKEATNMFLAFNGSKQKFNFWKMIVTSNCFFIIIYTPIIKSSMQNQKGAYSFRFWGFKFF